jgi:hypothetical protein
VALRRKVAFSKAVLGVLAERGSLRGLGFCGNVVLLVRWRWTLTLRSVRGVDADVEIDIRGSAGLSSSLGVIVDKTLFCQIGSMCRYLDARRSLPVT